MGTENQTSIHFYCSEELKGLPFSETVQVGNMLYLSGQIGVDASMQVVPGGITAETRQTLENIKASLEHCGSSLDHVVKVTVMLADIGEWAEMNKVYVTYFPSICRPAALLEPLDWLWAPGWKSNVSLSSNENIHPSKMERRFSCGYFTV